MQFTRNIKNKVIGFFKFYSPILLILIVSNLAQNCLLQLIDAMENSRREHLKISEVENCEKRSKLIADRISEKHAFLYVKIPKLSDEYLEYKNVSWSLYEESKRRERAIPVYIELHDSSINLANFNDKLLNPRKEDIEKYQVSSKIKERIISENSEITSKNCVLMALGSEYLFPIPAEKGKLTVIFYLDYARDIINYRKSHGSGKEEYFDQFIHRGLSTDVDFHSGRIYQIEIKINPMSVLPRGSYNGWISLYNIENTVPGFTITLQELPPNTKFAFDGKDDVGKTYEQVKKEFTLYDKDAAKNNE